MSDTYEPLETQTSFAMHGTLQADYPVTSVIDGLGMTILLDGVDTALLDEQAPFDAMGDNPLLAFVDNEIMAVFGWNLLAPQTYQIFCRRGKYATQIVAHDTGADCYLINLQNLPIITHPQFRYNNTAEIEVGPSSDPTGLAPIDLTIAGIALTLPPPVNLACNRITLNPTITTGQAATFTWSTPETELSFVTLVTFVAADGETVLSQQSVSVQTLAVAAAQLVTALGGALQTFYLQVQFQTAAEWETLLSPATQLKVIKV